MSCICAITKKKPLFGNSRSHSMNANKRKFLLNLQYHRFWVPEINKYIKIRISAKGLRMINKYGINKIYKRYIIKNNGK